MSHDLHINSRISLPRSELTYRFSRSSGPGGQFVNKVASRVELIFNVNASSALTQEQKRRTTEFLGRRIASDGTLRVLAQESRSQWKNRADAEAKLASILAAAVVPVKNRLPSRPTAASRARRIESKKIRSVRKRLRGRPSQDGN
jgi:ribosome-associated protein